MGQCWPQCSYPTTTSCQSTLRRRPRHRHCAPRRCSRCSPRPITRPVKSLIAHPHHTAEQLPRDHEDDALHYDRNHPSDDSLCADLSHGKISWSPLTSQDVRLNRILRGPCVHCVAGKLTEPPAPSSTIAPATSPGAVISLDVHMLP